MCLCGILSPPPPPPALSYLSRSVGVAQSKLRDPEANCEASAATICTKSDINARFVIRISETATDRPFLCPGIGRRRLCTHSFAALV